MPPGPKSGSALFLGLELATDQLRVSIVDESLDLVGVEAVDFDSELPEYQTHGGIFTTPGDAYTTPIEMWIKALDALLEKLAKNHDLSRIKAIGGASQHALVWWKSTPVPSLSTLDARIPLHTHFPASSFSMPHTPTAQDSSAHTHALALEALLGGPDLMAARVGLCGSPSLVAAQLLRAREVLAQEVWARTGRLQLASAFLASLIVGKWVGMGEAEACATGMWSHVGTGNGTQTPGQGQAQWDEAVLEIVGGSREEGRRLRGWLGDVDVSGGSKKIGNVSRYLVERYGFDPETIVTPFTTDYLSAYLSLCPSPGDAVLNFGPMDMMLAPAQHWIPTRLYSLSPHPAQEASEKRRYIVTLSSRNADVPRALVRDMYTKSWSAFDRLVAIVPPGGSIGLDDKLFSYWFLQGDSYPYSHVKGIFRFQNGVKVHEFRDLRANPRCLLESQVLAFRVKWARMIATAVLTTQRGRGNANPSSQVPLPGRSTSALSSLGLAFDPYDHTQLPTRILATGAAANFPSVANLVGDVFNAPVFVPMTQVDSAQIVPHRNAPAAGYASRSSLGGAYVARWLWGKERTSSSGRGLGGFEEEVRRLLGKRWVASGGTPLKTNVNGATAASAAAPSSGANSGTSTPYPGGRSALGTTVFVEEDEDEVAEMEKSSAAGVGLGIGMGVGAYAGSLGERERMRTQMGATAETASGFGSAGGQSGATALVTPDVGGGASPGANSPSTPGGTVAGTTTKLTPIVAMPTADAEAQIGLAKVAEPDLDAFMSYAAIVPEYCRLESMLVKGLV